MSGATRPLGDIGGGGSSAASPVSLRGFASAVPWRALGLVVVVALAYHYSLLTLARGLTLQTPLAYLGVVPVIALALGWARATRAEPVRPIHDRQVDYIVGIALVGLAAALLLLLPISLGSRFWLYRLDLLSLPLFVSGAVSLFYGVRRLWILRVPIAFLLLAWPLPYAPLVGDAMQLFTDATTLVLAGIAAVVPIATSASMSEGLFYIGEGPRAFAVTVAAACAGVNGLVGFILIGGALTYVVRGPWRRRVTWLIVGLLVVWFLNIARIELIFIVGATMGRQLALEVLHPFAGLVIFNLGVLAMVAMVPRFGLRFAATGQRSPERITTGRAGNPVRRVRWAFALTLAVAAGLAVLNTSFARYEEIANPLGQARLQPFDVRTAQVANWESGYVASNPQVTQFFGRESTWDRMLYTPTASASLTTTAPVYVDVINTDDPGSLAAYGVEECYQFHNYRIESVATVELGAGVTAEVIDYHNPRLGADWSAIWWEWPYETGSGISYSRMIVFIANGPLGEYGGIPTDVVVATQSLRFADIDRFLTALAREIVRSQLTRSLPT